MFCLIIIFCRVLLSQIIGILEMKKIDGITKNPRSTASALHNIRKGLEILKKKKVTTF